ncbi:alkaline shock response membrane anchor protein AmaP [Sneathia sanguinegens]|uniref:alkaline shock response membrane anchor protein AmaP n=1 Tax=Sneathia sanguinegens TaxID=40543 RepID=UPI0023F69D55|nr:alkaline shock response membrane anchor protein AmaP [Sneathia sanguinegens]
MFKILVRIINYIFLILLALCLYCLIVDPNFIANILDEFSMLLSTNNLVKFVSQIVIIIYFVFIIFSLLENLFKKPKKIKVSSENGEIEVTLKTIEEISKNFLESKDIVNVAKVSVKYTHKGPIINANIENFKTDEMNTKLANIATELTKYIKNMLGVTVKKVNLNINKINTSQVIEENIETEKVEEINDDVVEID